MPDVRLSAAARADLAEIDAYGFDRFGDDAADAYQRGIDQVLTRLESFPRIGEARPDYGADIRCVVHRSHRILYCVRKTGVLIVRVLHHSRDAARHLAK